MFMYISTNIHKNSDKVTMIKKPLKVNTASGGTLGLIGIAPLKLNIDNQNFAHNSVACTKIVTAPNFWT